MWWNDRKSKLFQENQYLWCPKDPLMDKRIHWRLPLILGWGIDNQHVPSSLHTIKPSYHHTILPSYHYTIIPLYYTIITLYHHTILPYWTLLSVTTFHLQKSNIVHSPGYSLAIQLQFLISWFWILTSIQFFLIKSIPIKSLSILKTFPTQSYP